MIREDFNHDWYVKRSAADAQDAYLPDDDVDSRRGKKVTLPHDAMILEARDPGNPAGAAGGFFPGYNYEYSKIFHAAASEKGKIFLLEFEGIYNRGYVFVNQGLAGSIPYGYTGLTVDITPFLQYDADNEIRVRVVNSDVPNSRWYTGAGIYRPVSLYRGGSVRMMPGDLRIQTPEISERIAAVKIESRICCDDRYERKVKVLAEILDQEGSVAAESISPVTLYAHGETPFTQRLYLRNPQLWSVDQPNLYQCRLTVLEDENVLDQDHSTFGIRSLTVNPMEGLLINGEPVLLRGGCIHHDNGPVGAATFGRSEERRIEILKEAGFNAIRAAHNSASRALLSACDRLGMLVMEESYDTWTQPKTEYDSALIFAEHWEKGLEDIVRKDFNHPSVIMYSVGNEISDLNVPEGARWNRRLAEKIRELDPTRYVTNAVNGLLPLVTNLSKVMEDLGLTGSGAGGSLDINDIMTSMLGQMNYLTTHPDGEKALKEVYETLDIIGMNYMRDVYEQMKEYPNRVFFGSETCPPDIDLNWKKVKAIPACLGDFTWSAWDYVGEAGVGIANYNTEAEFTKPYPAYLAYVGDIDITGFRRPMSYYREIVFGLRRKPYIAVQDPKHYHDDIRCTPWSQPVCISSWTWKGYEQQPCLVEVYSDAPEVELFINGRSVGILPAGEENRFKAVFDTIYQPGEVKAAAYYADGHMEEYRIQTAGDGAALRLRSDREELLPDELAYVTVDCADADGVVNTSCRCRVCLKVEGEGELLAFGSADPASEENFFDTERTMFYGRLIAVVRAGRNSGMIRVTAETKDHRAAEVEIVVR